MLTYKHGTWGPLWWILGLLFNSHHYLHLILCSSHSEHLVVLQKGILFQLHATHFVKTSLPISFHLPAWLILSYFIWVINIYPLKCQEIILDLFCWLLLHLELNFIIALIMLRYNYVPTGLWTTQETKLCLVSLFWVPSTVPSPWQVSKICSLKEGKNRQMKSLSFKHLKNSLVWNQFIFWKYDKCQVNNEVPL